MEIKKDKVNVEVCSDVDFYNYLNNILSKKQFNVLKYRYGIKSSRKTLDNIAQYYNVTRERIRQIESQALEKCRMEEHLEVFHTYLTINEFVQIASVFDEAPVILKANINKHKRLVSGLYRLSIDVVYNNISNWLDSCLEPFEKDGQHLGWFSSNTDANVRHQIVNKSNINVGYSLLHRIENTLRQVEWPVSISTIQDSLPDISESDILQCLKLELDAEIENGEITAIKNLRTSVRIVLILRYAKRPLHIKHVQEFDRNLFGSETSIRNLSATICRLSEVLIVGRGTYVLWDYVKISPNAIEHICDVCAKHLGETGEFLSCKILLNRIKTVLPPKISSQLTDYMLHGICQDSSRFITRRGLMIGLAHKNFNQSFISLTELIHSIVEKKGPISVSNINKQISEKRKVLDVNIYTVLKNSSTIVYWKNGLYDVIERVVGESREVDRLKYAIQISLIEQPLSMHMLVNRLSVVGINYSKKTIASYIYGIDYVSRENEILKLKAKDPLVVKYNCQFLKYYGRYMQSKLTKSELIQILDNCLEKSFADVDYRLAMKK